MHSQASDSPTQGDKENSGPWSPWKPAITRSQAAKPPNLKETSPSLVYISEVHCRTYNVCFNCCEASPDFIDIHQNLTRPEMEDFVGSGWCPMQPTDSQEEAKAEARDLHTAAGGVTAGELYKMEKNPLH